MPIDRDFFMRVNNCGRIIARLIPLALCCLVAAAFGDAIYPPSKAGDAATANKAAGATVDPGHSQHGEAFDEGPRQKARLMPGMPKIDFPVTTKSREAQAFFNQGVGQLHGFWYFEAERSFRQAAAIDPACAMAYWGMAQANINNPKRAKEMIAKAVAAKAHRQSSRARLDRIAGRLVCGRR